jgi:hypothetical protein
MPLTLVALLAALAGGGATHYWLAAHRHHAAAAQHVVVAPPARPRSADFGAVSPSADVRRVADWVVTSADHGGRPFALVDKVQASVYVFAPTGHLVGASPVLLGFARGDDSEPGIGDKAIAAIRPEERTTPAGRFVAQPGRNSGGEKVIWVDYNAAVSMHSVRATVASERRLQRLGSPDPAEHRISWGCINLPAAFFASVAWPSFGANGGVIYVLPETRPLTDVFPALRGTAAATAG